MNQLIVGLDIGTSSVKAAAFTLDGMQKAAATVRYPQYSPNPGWAEQDPADWISGALEAVRSLTQHLDPSSIKAVGLSGQSPSHALADVAGRPLSRGIIWRDHRAIEESDWLKKNFTGDELRKWTGLDDVSGATLSPARILWFKNHQPEVFKQARYIAHPKDLVGFALTGRMATDLSTAFTLVNPVTGMYEEEYLERLGIPLNFLPVVVSPTEVMGTISAHAASITGLLEGTPVVAGTIDAFCDSLAGGATYPGWAVDVAGTSEVVSLGTAAHNSGLGVYLASIGHAGQFLCGPSQAGGDTLAWFARILFPEHPTSKIFKTLEEYASIAPPGCNGVVFLPYLNGERAPVWDPKASGCFFGLTFQHNRQHFIRAVYEGVAFAVRHILETCEEVAGIQASQVNICGGGSCSLFWNQIKANILQRPVYPSLVKETACLGSAILGSVGIGLHPNLNEAIRTMARFGNPIEPQNQTAAIYQEAYQLYRHLYPSLQSLYS